MEKQSLAQHLLQILVGINIAKGSADLDINYLDAIINIYEKLNFNLTISKF